MLSAREVGAAPGPATMCGRHAVHHGVIGEVGQRMAERRQLPVEHRQDARLGRVEDHVVDAKVAMDDRGLVARGDMGGQPFDQPVHVRVAPGVGIVEILA